MQDQPTIKLGVGHGIAMEPGDGGVADIYVLPVTSLQQIFASLGLPEVNLLYVLEAVLGKFTSGGEELDLIVFELRQAVAAAGTKVGESHWEMDTMGFCATEDGVEVLPQMEGED